jgi:hypothetical protein
MTGIAQFDQQALVMGIQVLHQYECHSGLGGSIGQQLFESREAAG